MSILINTLYARPVGSAKTYLSHLFSHLPPNKRDNIIVLANNDNYHLWEKFGVRVIISKWASKSYIHRIFFENFILPHLLRSEKVSVYFTASGLLPVWLPKNVRAAALSDNMLPFSPENRRRYPLGYIRFRLWLLHFIMMRSFLKANLVIYVSQYAQKVIEQHLSNRRGKSVVIPHGLDDDFYFRKDRPFPKELSGEYVLYVSTITVYKAQIEVIQAWEALRQKRKSTREKLLIIGWEYPPYAAKVKTLISRLQLDNEVIILGKIEHEELPAYYQHAKINLFASSCENCPNILLEALASGKPVFCSDYPPMPEFGGDAVEYFDPYSPESLTNLLLKYLDNEEYREELGKRGLQRSEQFHSKQEAERTWKLLFQLTDKE